MKTITCERCKKTYVFKRAMEGKRLTCPTCQLEFDVPKSSEELVLVTPAMARAEKSGTAYAGVSVIVALAGVVFVLAVLASFFSPGVDFVLSLIGMISTVGCYLLLGILERMDDIFKKIRDL